MFRNWTKSTPAQTQSCLENFEQNSDLEQITSDKKFRRDDMVRQPSPRDFYALFAQYSQSVHIMTYSGQAHGTP